MVKLKQMFVLLLLDHLAQRLDELIPRSEFKFFELALDLNYFFFFGFYNNICAIELILYAYFLISYNLKLFLLLLDRLLIRLIFCLELLCCVLEICLLNLDLVKLSFNSVAFDF